MKKSLIIALATCLLFLVGCGSLAGTGTPSSAPASQKTATVTTTNSPQTACRVLQAQQVRLEQEIQTTAAQLSAAHGDPNIVRQAQQTLIRLHWVLAQIQAGLQGCKTTH